MEPIIIFPEIRLPLRTLAGLREELFTLGETEVARTVNGRAVVLDMPWGRKWGIRYTLDGDRRLSPSIDDLHLGRRLKVWPATGFSKSLAPGQVSIVLDRDPVPGSLHARDPDSGEVVDVTLNADRVVTLMGRAGWTTVYYRADLDCLVTRISGLGSDVTGLRQNASFEVEEV